MSQNSFLFMTLNNTYTYYNHGLPVPPLSWLLLFQTGTVEPSLGLQMNCIREECVFFKPEGLPIFISASNSYCECPKNEMYTFIVLFIEQSQLKYFAILPIINICLWHNLYHIIKNWLEYWFYFFKLCLTLPLA